MPELAEDLRYIVAQMASAPSEPEYKGYLFGLLIHDPKKKKL